jgi:hypothetical protein
LEDKLRILLDNRGSPIRVGQTVAYNYSGQIGVGVITDIQDTKIKTFRVEGWTTKSLTQVKIKIKQTFPNKGKESVVTDERNLLVLFAGE